MTEKRYELLPHDPRRFAVLLNGKLIGFVHKRPWDLEDGSPVYKMGDTLEKSTILAPTTDDLVEKLEAALEARP